MKRNSLLFIIFTAFFSSIAFVLFLIEIPILPELGHLKLDFSDVPAVIAAAIFNPLMGILVELIKNLIELFTKGIATQMGFGNFMNFLVGCAYLLPFSIIYRKRIKSNNSYLSTTLPASIFGVLSMILFGLIGNYFIAPLYFKLFLNTTLDTTALYSVIIGATVLNLIKGVLISIIVYPLIFLFKKNLSKFIK